MDKVAIIDFEASCLPEDSASFPVEVALAKVGGTVRTWLIRPSPRWRYWDWCEQAERLHGISRAMLEREGTDARQVLAELAAEARGFQVYADSDLDAYWLETLAEACGQPAPFPIRFIGELFQHMRMNSSTVTRAEAKARRRMPAEHVACKDARRLAITVELLAAA